MLHLESASSLRRRHSENGNGFREFVLQCAQEGAQAGQRAEPCIEPLLQDQRFASEAWQQWPFNVFYQSHLLAQQWWHVATTGVPGVSAPKPIRNRVDRAKAFGTRRL